MSLGFTSEAARSSITFWTRRIREEVRRQRFGFTAAQPQSLADALAWHFRTALLIRKMIDEAGATRLICEGPLQGLDGRATFVRTVWVLEKDDYARLLTIVPLPRQRPK